MTSEADRLSEVDFVFYIFWLILNMKHKKSVQVGEDTIRLKNLNKPIRERTTLRGVKSTVWFIFKKQRNALDS